MKFLRMLCMLAVAPLAYAGNLEIINDANHNIFISDHRQQAMLIMPGQSNLFTNDEAHTTLYIYTETDKAQQFYELAFQLIEKFEDHRKTTLLFNDIANKSIDLLHPNRFTVLTADEIKQHKHHNKQRATSRPQSKPQPPQYTAPPPVYQPQPYQPAEMHGHSGNNDISPELVQSILAQIQRGQQAQRSQQFSPYQQQAPTAPSADHIVGHHHQPHHTHTAKRNNSAEHHHTNPAPAPIPTSTQSAPQPAAHAGHHHHKHSHTHSSKSKRQRNLHRGSKFMNDSKK